MRALILGASGGIGSALTRALTGHNVTTLSRSEDGLDLEDVASIERLAASAPTDLDLVINATGVLSIDGVDPERTLDAIDADVMRRILNINTVGAALVLKHFRHTLASDRRAVFASLSARLGSIGDNGLGGWTSYRASKAALNQVVRCAAIEIRRKRPQSVVIALHPGTIETPLTRKYARGRYTATADEAAQQLLDVMARVDVSETGGFFDYSGAVIPY